MLAVPAHFIVGVHNDIVDTTHHSFADNPVSIPQPYPLGKTAFGGRVPSYLGQRIFGA
jgi:hypothetical protein